MLLYVGDTLAEGDWTTRPDQQRTEILQIAKAVRKNKQMQAAIHRAQQLIELIANDEDSR